MPHVCMLLLCLLSAFLHAEFLPDSMEITTQVLPKMEQRFEFASNESDLFVWITPCALAHWRLYRVLDGDKEEDSNVIVGEDEGISFAPLPSSGIPSHPSLNVFPHLQLIAGEEGDHRMEYYSSKMEGVRLLLVLTTSAPAFVRLARASSAGAIYPPLPSDVRPVTAFSNDSLLIKWKISNIVREHEDDGRFRFCVIVSRHEPTAEMSCGGVDENMESIHCVNQTVSRVVIEGVSPSRSYFVTVFIRENISGKTSMYATREIGKTRPTELAEGKLHSLSVDGPRGNAVAYSVRMANPSKALLVVHSCAGYVRIAVHRNDRLIRRSDSFTGFRRFLVVNATGQLKIEVINEDNKANKVRLWMGSSPEQSPYPLLPDDTSVKVSRRGCNWAVLEWLRSSDEHAEYCMYQRKERASMVESLVHRVDNLCEGGLPHSLLIGCYSHRGSESSDVIGVIETTVNGLLPGSTYRFDLLATPLHRENPQPLPYRTIWVRTASSC